MTITNRTEKFEQAVKRHMTAFGVDLSTDITRQLTEYYSMLTAWNERLHLVAPCSPEEFATRHVLESLLLLRHLPPNARISDVGSGAGLPIVPCLIARPDLSATLIESSQKKTVFLREVLNHAGLSKASTVIAQPFEQTAIQDAGFVSCRALDRFTSKLPGLISWSPAGAELLLFGGESVREVLNQCSISYSEYLIPQSEKRFLFVADKSL